MKLRFTYHAQSQLLARNIPASYVADTIRSPQATASTPGGAMMYRRAFDGHTLEIVCVKSQQKKEYLILTMYYL